MDTAAQVTALIEAAFDRLHNQTGYAERPAQRQLALLIADMILGAGNGLFEAPTGLGKSLATLIPAIACALVSQRRTAIATYTNILAEQYWRKDLPLALALFDEEPTTAFLIGRQRYVCRLRLEEEAPQLAPTFIAKAKLGLESEFREIFPTAGREAWRAVQVPPACPAHACPLYDECYLYSARQEAQTALVVITNHSLVLTHALMNDPDADRDGPLGRLDHLILDEAHDFPQAAIGGLETELSAYRFDTIDALAGRVAAATGHPKIELARVRFGKSLDAARTELQLIADEYARPVLVAVAPEDLKEHPAIEGIFEPGALARLSPLITTIASGCTNFAAGAEFALADSPEALDATRNLISYIRDAGKAVGGLIQDADGRDFATHLTSTREGPLLRKDPLDYAPLLTELLWDRFPTTALSATLALDGEFDHFKRITGFRSDFEEILPSPFDFATQAAVYLPPLGAIPDPTTSRDPAVEPLYYQAVADELSRLITLAGGRTLALFHSRKEMEGVGACMRLPTGLPLLLQPRGGSGDVGRQFRSDIPSSLLALRSFWTGFDAPGETLSVVVLVRVPFDVPTEPAQIARLVYLAQKGFDPFRDHTLANAKMLLRQGSGRLVRSPEDRGLIAILDPRVRTKRYGEELLANLPPGMRQCNDPADALGWLELGQ